ncbi:hypothetical protein GCM10027284_30680 [Cyclobacterium sediminis]
MKYSAYCFAFCLILACSGPKTGEDGASPSLNITMDTVLINPGQEILYLNSRLRLSALSDDKKYLYNVNPQEYLIEQIDLNKLAFKKIHRFEKEGPNGIGQYFFRFSLIDEDRLFFSTYEHEGIFNWEGKKLKTFNITELGKGQGQLVDEDRPFKTISRTPGGNQFVSLISNFQEKSNSLALIDLDQSTFIKLAIPAIEKAQKFQIILREGQGSAATGLDRYLLKEGDKILVGTEASSELYVMEMESDSLKHITFKSQLTPNEKTGEYPSEVSDRTQFRNYLIKIKEEINFMAPVWDEEKQVYYRFSYQMTYDESKVTDENQFFPQPSGAIVYLSVLDKELNLITEGKVPELSKSPPFHFAKDGKLWLFENIEDEMGFVRLDIKW